MNENTIRAIIRDEKVPFLSLQFTDILGVPKSVTVPVGQLDKALAGEVMFDGSSIEGFVRIEESDMYLIPDRSTFAILPWTRERQPVARLICDVHAADGTPFAGCPRRVLRDVCTRIADAGLVANAGPELEFFLFPKDEDCQPITEPHDKGSYFDLLPRDLGNQVREEIMLALTALGFEVEAAHHEAAFGQHEIDFRYTSALRTADNVATARLVIKTLVARHNLHATFLPKPIYGINGSGMHTHLSLFADGRNIFWDEQAEHELAATARHFIGGLLDHARGFCALTNPLVNSYKRLVPGYEAPVYISWALRNRSALVRIPSRRGSGTRVELRNPDPSCNPYLALAVVLAAGMDGVERRLDPGPPTNIDIYALGEEERAGRGIRSLPGTLVEALEELSRDEVVRRTLGEHIYANFMAAKRLEWEAYKARVTSWELENYLELY